MKACKLCLQEKPLEDFGRRKTGKDGRKAICKECVKSSTSPEDIAKRKEAANRWRKENGDKARARGRRWHHRHPKAKLGLTTEEYEDLLDYQEGKCAICSRLPGEDRRLALDHDHRNGMLRGLLCSNCNRGLGVFNDNPALLLKAIMYLAHHSDRPISVVDIEDISAMYRSGSSETEIAYKYGVAGPYIHELLVRNHIERRPLVGKS